jgi:UDP-glucose 4-epimerase
VLHFAAFALVSESVDEPALYYRNNVIASLELLEAMRESGVKKIVFSSTTATYGEPRVSPIPETCPQSPINPYGFTKYVVESALSDYSRAYGMAYAALRYFNAAGADPSGDIGEDHSPETHLIPLVLQVALRQRSEVKVYGDCYSTIDGTCVRDYVHVCDLADAHVLALSALEANRELVLNLGTGKGTSVRQIIESCRRVTGIKIPFSIAPPRKGDPSELVADARKAFEVLGWRPRFTDIDEIIKTAWNWHCKHPLGFESRCQGS